MSTLSRSRESAVGLGQLLADDEMRDQVLDHEQLMRAILEANGTLAISSHLYFYVLTRHVLKSAGIGCRDLTDYIASLLVNFSLSSRLAAAGNGSSEAYYVSDMLLALQKATPRQAFLLRAHIGNYSLFLTGIFHERIDCRAKRGAPDCGYYERMGSASFREVSRNHVAKECQLDGIYDGLADRFHDVRLALNRLSEEILSIEEPVHPTILS